MTERYRMTMRVPIRRRVAAWRQGIVVTTVLATLVALLAVGAQAANAATGNRVDLRVLLFVNGTSNADAIAAQMNQEGVPYTTVDLSNAGRPIVTDAFLENAATHEGFFQAVVLPHQPGAVTLSAAEQSVLAGYETAYGVRQVDGYVYPGSTVGLNTPTFAGTLDGSSATVTAVGLSGPFSYLSGSLPIDNFDPTVSEVYGYLATPATLAVGQSFTPLVTDSVAGSNGSLLGVYAHDGVEELVVTAAFSGAQQWFKEMGHGIITWMTRGVHLGNHRNYFATQIDDVFLADSRWSATGHCTPGDGCVDPTTTTPDIRMTPAEVTKLVDWQNANGFKLDMVFNGGGSDLWKTDIANPAGTDPLADAFTAPATASQFTWINHTYTHEFLGCIQVAPTVVGPTWHCATTTDTGPYMDPALVPTKETTVGTSRWMSQAEIASQIGDNIAWATAHGLPNFDSTQLVTGEHSGLTTLPQQTTDNPFLAGALASQGVLYTASDASREASSRVIGSTTTVPRHPMNIFYNAGTYGDEVSEYNWLYTSAAQGGSDNCVINSATTTCMPQPLANGDAVQAKASFDSYIQPIEVRNALGFALSGDPRPFYAHQSNLSEDGILYPVVAGVLDTYKSRFDTTKSPLVHLDLKGQAEALRKMTAWGTTQPTVTAYRDGTGVHVSGTGSVPLTVPTGTALNGITLDSYDGELSGWINAPAADTVVAVPVTVLPGAPTIGVATAGNASATATWTAPTVSGDSPITGYTVNAYAGGATTPAQTLTTPATSTSLLVPGLTNGTAYTFTVAATNAGGTGPASALSAAVTPVTVPAAPTIGPVTAGNASATVTWTAPAANGGTPITGYTVRIHNATGVLLTLPAATATATATSVSVTGLTNGTAYTFDVAATSSAGTGAYSTLSATVTPVAGPSAPTIGTVTAGVASARVTWTAPTSPGGSPITGYAVRAYVGAGTAASVTQTTAATARNVTVPGLTNGTAYTFDVSAVTALGTGPASARSAAVTPRTVPGAPTIGIPEPGAASATVRWTPPADNGGSAITGYTVRAYAGTATSVLRSQTAPAGTTSLVVTGLPNGTAYTFTVAATNAAGTGAFSARSVAVTSATVPRAPVIGTAVAGTAGGAIEATANWAPPTVTGGSPITGYRVTALQMSAGTVLASTVSGDLPATSRSLTMTLPVGGNYRFTVQAINAAGVGASSARSNRVAGR